MTGVPSALPRFLLLYAALFAAFGVASPFFAAFLAERGLRPEVIGLVLSAGTAIRLVAGPVGGRVADRLRAPRLVLVGYAAASSCIAFGYLPAEGALALLLIGVLHAATLAPLTPIADALALQAGTPATEASPAQAPAIGTPDTGTPAIGMPDTATSDTDTLHTDTPDSGLPDTATSHTAIPDTGTPEPKRRQNAATHNRFEYGWVRGAGSAAFIVGTVLAGQAVSRFGLIAIVWLNGTLLGVTACCAWLVPDLLSQTTRARQVGSGVGSLLRLPVFRRLMLVAALIQGSHVLHDSFAVIYWRKVGIGDGTIGLLWSESVAAEVVVFLFLGRWLLDRLSPAGASILCAVGGIVRWAVMAEATSAVAFAAVEPLHGLTFALQHLACMRMIVAVVPPELAATAQAFYGTVAVGLATALLLLASGPLYANLGASGFWVMAGFCAAAIPIAWALPRRA